MLRQCFGRIQALSQARMGMASILRRTAVTMETDEQPSTPYQPATQYQPSAQYQPSTQYRPRERCINSVQLLGRVGGDPRNVGRDRPLVVFSMATNRSIRVRQPDNSVTQDSRVTWHLINVLQRPAAEYVLKYVKKGSRILVNGRLESRNLLKADGTEEKRIAVVVDDIIMVRMSRNTVEEDDTAEERASDVRDMNNETSGTDFSYEMDHGSFSGHSPGQ